MIAKRWLLPVALVLLAGFGVVTLALVAGSASSGTKAAKALAIPSPKVLRAGWVRLSKADAGLQPGSFVTGVVWGPGGFVAVGGTGAPTVTRIWTSVTGRKWTPVPSGDMPPSGTIMSTVGWVGSGLIAVGSSGPEGAGAVVWRSDDGSHWTDVTSQTNGLPAGWSVIGLVRFGPAAVAYGARTGVGTPTGAVWISADGLAWQETDLPGVVGGIVLVGGGRLVALVELPTASGREDVIFTSSDGHSWKRGSDLGASTDPGVENLGLWQGHPIALTYPGGNHRPGVLWRSNDGVTWIGPSALGPEVGPGMVDAVTTIGPYVMATGADPAGAPGGWVSAFDSTFVARPALGAPPGGRLNRTATDGYTLVAFGTAQELADVYLWHVPPTDRSDIP